VSDTDATVIDAHTFRLLWVGYGDGYPNHRLAESPGPGYWRVRRYIGTADQQVYIFRENVARIDTGYLLLEHPKFEPEKALGVFPTLDEATKAAHQAIRAKEALARLTGNVRRTTYPGSMD
jgi:hypothetical protein